jgi:branched-chain amino acid transport system permease protein
MRTGIFHRNYEADERAIDSGTQWVLVAIGATLLAALPFYGSDYVLAIACIMGIHIVAALGLNITTGMAGLISLSHAAFLGVGCYTAAVLSRWSVPFFLVLPVAGLVTAAVGIVVGLPSLRVKGLYLVIATLAAHFVLTFVFREWTSVTGGMGGVKIARPDFFGFAFTGDRRIFYLIYTCVALLVVADINLKRSYIGRAFVAVRDRDISAEILGVDLLKTKLLAFAIGAFYAGVAGALVGYFYNGISPEYFTLTLAIFYLAAVIVGGLGRTLGSVLGASFMTFVPEVLRLLSHLSSQWVPNAATLLLPMGQMAFGLLIVGFLIFESHGLAEIWSRIRRQFHLWPYKT